MISEKLVQQNMKNLKDWVGGESKEIFISKPMVSSCCGSHERAGYDEDTQRCADCKEVCIYITEDEYYE